MTKTLAYHSSKKFYCTRPRVVRISCSNKANSFPQTSTLNKQTVNHRHYKLLDGATTLSIITVSKISSTETLSIDDTQQKDTYSDNLSSYFLLLY